MKKTESARLVRGQKPNAAQMNEPRYGIMLPNVLLSR